MAKTIKFNLICDEKPIRTIEDLQNNFSIEDVLTYYNNKLLHRWLSVRGYDAELKAVSAITTDDSIEIIKELIHIFNVETDEKKVEESIYMFQYQEERRQTYEIYKIENYNVVNIIEDYEHDYLQLVRGILMNPNDVSLIKANIAEMVSNYDWVFELNHRELFWNLMKRSPLGVMCLLMNEESRKYYLPGGDNEDKKRMFQAVCNLIEQSDFEKLLRGNLITFSGMTDGYWKDLEPKGKKFMIVSMEIGDFVRSAGKSGGDLTGSDIKNAFVILDGIDYKSNYSSHKLRYMEV